MISSAARIGFVFNKRGMAMEAGSSWFLPRLVGMQQAQEWVMSAELFGADEALKGGLVRSVHAPEDLLPAAQALAAKFAASTSSAVAAAVNRRLMQAVLGQLGCQWHAAENGREALQSLTAATYDVVLMDLHMREIDGLATTRRIRAGEAGDAVCGALQPAGTAICHAPSSMPSLPMVQVMRRRPEDHGLLPDGRDPAEAAAEAVEQGYRPSTLTRLVDLRSAPGDRL